jgi:hypothetical protein
MPGEVLPVLIDPGTKTGRAELNRTRWAVGPRDFVSRSTLTKRFRTHWKMGVSGIIKSKV